MLVTKILCPTDLSIHSSVGIAYGISLARENQAELVVLYVTSFPIHLFACPEEFDAVLRTERVRRFTVERWMHEIGGKVGNFVRARFGSELQGLSWRPKVGVGKVAREIVSAAFQEEADMIVMAKRHLKFVPRILSRSISEAVRQKAPCPVFSVCPPKILRPWQGTRLPSSRRVLQGSEA